jgi:hypothetical protein
MIAIWFILLVPSFILIMVLGNRRRNEEEDEEVGSGTYLGEEEEEEEEEEDDDEHEGGGKKTKEDQMPLWKYIRRLGGGRRGGTTKFICRHCNTTYIGSYTQVRKHLCGVMPWDEKKTIGVKTCGVVPTKDRAKYKREEEQAQYKSKKSRLEQETESSHRPFSAHSPSTMVVDSHPCIIGVKHYQTSLTLVVGMTWMQKCSSSFMHVAYHSLFFAHRVGMK